MDLTFSKFREEESHPHESQSPKCQENRQTDPQLNLFKDSDWDYLSRNLLCNFFCLDYLSVLKLDIRTGGEREIDSESTRAFVFIAENF